MVKLIDAYDLPLNPAEPEIMHVDMNSCFATIEQQANPLLRGRPCGVCSYTTPRGIIIAPSIEAKQLGIKLGTTVREAKTICRDFVPLENDPPKYRDAHIRFKKIFMDYTDRVTPKSIDEAVLDLSNTPILKLKTMEEIGFEIKQRVYEELGEWVRVNVGIGSNRFFAKTAAGLHKPDGLDVMDSSNALEIYRSMELTDLCGINWRYEVRLNANGIYSPLQFFSARMDFLKKQVFKSIVGRHWYMRLRGWEVDAIDFGRKSFGHTYALGQKTADKDELSKLLMKLCEKTGRRLRRANYHAQGVHVSMLYQDRTYWHKGYTTKTRLYTTDEIFRYAMLLFNKQPQLKVVTNLAVSVFNLVPHSPEQIGLFDGGKQDKEALARSIDEVNDRYGEFVITPALMMSMDKTVLDRIAFGGVRDLDDLYSEK